MDGDFRTQFVRDPAALKHYPALVLNADYRPLSYYPLSLWPWQEVVKSVFLERVDVVAEYDQFVHSPSLTMKLPSVIALREFVKQDRQPAFTRFNVFLRDKFSCQYCTSNMDLTFDHIVPRSKGGQTTWENVVAACKRCNSSKRDRFLHETNMRLPHAPRTPSFMARFVLVDRRVPDVWSRYLVRAPDGVARSA